MDLIVWFGLLDLRLVYLVVVLCLLVWFLLHWLLCLFCLLVCLLVCGLIDYCYLIVEFRYLVVWFDSFYY